MTSEHAFLQSMLEAPDDLGLPLIFADYLDEHGDATTAELLRLIVTESNSARHLVALRNRLIDLRNELFERERAAGWLVYGDRASSGVVFWRDLESEGSCREFFAVCFERRQVRCGGVRLVGNHWSLTTREGQSLLRRRLDRNMVDWYRAAHRAPSPGLNELFGKEQKLYQTDLPLANLPAELVVPISWRLCEYLYDKQRRVRAGQVVPGAHFFAFSAGEIAWRHARVLDGRQLDRAESLLREGFRSRSLFGAVTPQGVVPLAGLLVRASDEGTIRACKLIWVRGQLVKETSDLPPRAAASLPEGSFRDALVDLKLSAAAAEAFVVASEERLRQLFRAQAARE